VDRTSWGVFDDEEAEEEKLNHPVDFFSFTFDTEDELCDLEWDFCVDPIPLKGGGGEPVEFEIAEVVVCAIGG
jgi:hypothetical protein